MAIDFIIEIPELSDLVIGQSYDIITTIIYTLTKYARFISYRIIIIVEELAYLLIREVFAHYSILEYIISDRDKLFISKFNIGLKKVLKIEEGILIIFYP